MAQIDSSIYFQQQPIDVSGSVAKGLNMADMIYQRQQQRRELQKQQDLKDAFNAGITQNQDGSISHDPSKTIAAIANLAKNPNSAVGGQDLVQAQQQFATQAAQQAEAKQKKQQADAAYTFQSLDPAKVRDQASWIAAKQQAIKDGHLEASQLPDQYDPNLQKQLLDHAQRLALTPEQYSNLQEKQQTHQDLQAERGLKREDLQNQRDTAASNKSADAYQKATHDINTFRGNTAIQQASSALINVQNALSLANRGKLSPSDLHLFASEMGKLATNGVPGHSEIAALVPNTAKSKLAEFVQFFSNNPSDADAQAFVDHNKTYLMELAKNYGKAVDTYKANILDGYKRKLDPEDYADLKKRIDSQSFSSSFEPPHPVDQMSDDEVRAAYQKLQQSQVNK